MPESLAAYPVARDVRLRGDRQPPLLAPSVGAEGSLVPSFHPSGLTSRFPSHADPMTEERPGLQESESLSQQRLSAGPAPTPPPDRDHTWWSRITHRQVPPRSRLHGGQTVPAPQLTERTPHAHQILDRLSRYPDFG